MTLVALKHVGSKVSRPDHGTHHGVARAGALGSHHKWNTNGHRRLRLWV